MLGQVVTLTLLLLLKGYQGKGCQGSADHVFSISGMPLQLQPNSIQMKIYNVQWKMWLPSQNAFCQILQWENGSSPSNTFNNRFSFIIKNLTLLIKAAQQQDSGLYCLEVTNTMGQVQRAKFQVFVFESLLPDKVEKPRLQGQGKILNRERCQVALSCLVSRDDNVTYAWYRGSKLIQTAGNLTYLEEEVDIHGTHTYTCNVSNPVSWESHTLNLTQDCQNAHHEFKFWPFLVIIVILSTLFLGTLVCFCVWRRKRKGKQSGEWKVLGVVLLPEALDPVTRSCLQWDVSGSTASPFPQRALVYAYAWWQGTRRLPGSLSSFMLSDPQCADFPADSWFGRKHERGSSVAASVLFGVPGKSTNLPPF
ncbi:natural killer cell receptor 2B4 isoform X1 [Trachypithecus francoisi]|uniref:natural killer cell receptor 2B4 isoform X1 n=1 Tax=Trachypithecus francoisi TaxID=54180 RepID=UPI00141A9C1F|nr:natural killer cell receptor 2B4 isoform X1 [Trachypithecus francoisi]